MLFLYSHSKFFRAIYENYGYSLKALWVVWESIIERNYRLKKKNYLSGPNCNSQSALMALGDERSNFAQHVLKLGVVFHTESMDQEVFPGCMQRFKAGQEQQWAGSDYCWRWWHWKCTGSTDAQTRVNWACPVHYTPNI